MTAVERDALRCGAREGRLDARSGRQALYGRAIARELLIAWRKAARHYVAPGSVMHARACAAYYAGLLAGLSEVSP